MKQVKLLVLVLTMLPAVMRAQFGSSDTDQLKLKIVAMGVYFDGIWKDFFQKQPHPYVHPKITWYTGKINSGCGELGPGNAFYCYRDNTVYCELNFLLEQKRLAAKHTRTRADGTRPS